MTRRRILIALLIVVVLGSAILFRWAAHATPTVRDAVVDALNARFESQVDLQSLDVSVYPDPGVSGRGLVLRHNGRTDVPPLIALDSFDATASLRGLLAKPIRLKDVTLEGLSVHIPPGGLTPKDGADDDEPRRPTDTPPPTIVPKPVPPLPVQIDSIHSRHARLEVASKRANRLPRVFDIEDLVMRGFGDARGAEFHAGLTNPIPRGRIETSGLFGPWNADDPDLTPISGEYAFKQANLDDIKGIGGTLSSVGTYSGVLRRVDVTGQTETPDFSIDIAGHPVPLTTQFKAVVDGTNGDTWLDHVEARLARTTIVAHGAVVRTRVAKGRRVSLDLKIAQGHIEDLLRLAVKSGLNPMLGNIDLDTKFLLPEGDADVVDRLQLDGSFKLVQARFTNIDVQRKINVAQQSREG